MVTYPIHSRGAVGLPVLRPADCRFRRYWRAGYTATSDGNGRGAGAAGMTISMVRSPTGFEQIAAVRRMDFKFIRERRTDALRRLISPESRTTRSWSTARFCLPPTHQNSVAAETEFLRIEDIGKGRMRQVCTPRDGGFCVRRLRLQGNPGYTKESSGANCRRAARWRSSCLLVPRRWRTGNA